MFYETLLFFDPEGHHTLGIDAIIKIAQLFNLDGLDHQMC